jgi:hypothetical protein
MVVLMEAMRADIDSGRIVSEYTILLSWKEKKCTFKLRFGCYFLFFQNMPNVAEAFRTTDADIQKAQDASGQSFFLAASFSYVLFTYLLSPLCGR